MNKDAIEKPTTSKEGFKKAVMVQMKKAFKVVWVYAVKADSFKAVREALDHFKTVGIRLWVSTDPAGFKMVQPA